LAARTGATDAHYAREWKNAAVFAAVDVKAA
jgi:hypothetical protein